MLDYNNWTMLVEKLPVSTAIVADDAELQEAYERLVREQTFESLVAHYKLLMKLEDW